MSVPHQILLYASFCARNDFYLDRIRDAAKRLGVSCTVEKVTDEAQIARAGVEITCLESYCPGCRAQHAGAGPDERYTPALSIDGKLAAWNVPADDDTLEKLLRECL